MSLALAVLADVVATDSPVGLGASLVALILLTTMVALDGRYGFALGPGRRARRLLMVAIAMLMAMVAVRDSPDLLGLNVFAIWIAATLLIARVNDRPLVSIRIPELVVTAIDIPIHSFLRAWGCGRRLTLAAFSRSPGSDEVPAPARRSPLAGHGRDIAIGTLIALPILAVFTTLLASADDGFADLVGRFFEFDIAAVFNHVGTVISLGMCSAIALIAVLDARPTAHMKETRRAWAGPAVVWIVLGSIAGLFAVFLALQARYLFGGAAYLADRTGLTAAEYARQGFFELLAVAALVVPLLMLVRHWYSDEPAATRAFRITAPLLATLAVVLEFSAIVRLWMYQDRFGLTEDRIDAGATLAWIALVLVWLALRIARAKPLHLASYSVASGLVVVLVLNVMNPEGLVARTNIQRADQGTGSIDAQYLATLSADATPVLVDEFEHLNPAERRLVARQLLAWDARDHGDWRSANLGRSRAAGAIDHQRAELERAAAGE